MPVISFGGLGSGIDTDAIVKGLVNASSGNFNALQRRATDTRSAVTSLSEISSLMSKFKTAVDELSTVQGVGGFKANSSDAAIVATADGSALPSSFSIQVNSLASAQRTYSKGFASASDALAQSGTLSLQVGSDDAVDITIESGDSLSAIASKINASGAKVNASVFFDGTVNRLQISGLDSGADNNIAFTESAGIELNLDVPANTVQQAQDASIDIDGFTVTRPTNQFSGVIQGVNLAVTKTTTDPVTVRVEGDPDALKTRLQGVVDAFNNVISKVHLTSGFGQVKANTRALAGDSTLRTLTDRLGSSLQNIVSGAGDFSTLRSIGVSLIQGGTLKLDEAAFSEALAADPASVSAILAGTDTEDGIMDIMGDLADTFTQSGTGLLSTRQETLTQRAKNFDDSALREQDRLTNLAEILRKQFLAMDSQVASSNAQLEFLAQLNVR